MAEEEEIDQNAAIRGILESMISGEQPPKGVSADNVAQLLAAAIAQAGQTILNVQGSPQTNEHANHDEQVTVGDELESRMSVPKDNFTVNPEDTILEENEQNLQLDDTEVLSTIEIPTSDKPRVLCIKFPIELRRQIIAMRKEGKKCRDIAKELKVSVSGVHKVWERFLATGMVHDRKPSTYAGRPRKYPISPRFEIQYTSENVLDTDSTHIEYVTITQGESGETIPTSTAVTEDGSVFVEGPLDMPGATVEIVETDSQPVLTPRGKNKSKKDPPVYREQLLLRLIEDCPLAALRNDVSNHNSPHVLNLESISQRPLYMEYVFGHPFGKVPASKPFERDVTEASIIHSDPANPIGKELLATLGYSTKVYFNMCCKPSPLFDPEKVLSGLPFSLGPGYIAETTQSVLQLLVDLCNDPVVGLDQLPSGNGVSLAATSTDGIVTTTEVSLPDRLSVYWSMLYQCAALLGCCENFLSASPPSAPCLLCHPYEKLAMQLEIKDPPDEPPLHADMDSYPIQVDTEQSSLSQIDSVSTVGLSETTVPNPESVLVETECGKNKGRWRRNGRHRHSSDTLTHNDVEVDGQFEITLSESSAVTVSDVQSNPLVVMTSTTNSTGEPVTPPQVLVHVQASLNDYDSTPTIESSSISEHAYSRLQTPLIINRNRSTNISQLEHTPTTSSTNTAAEQLDKEDTTSSSTLHQLLASNETKTGKALEGITQNNSTGNEDTNTVVQFVRRSPRKRTPHMLKSYSPDTSSTYKASPASKKTRKQKLTEISPSQNDDSALSSSSSQPRRGSGLKSHVNQNVTTSEGEKHPMEWGVEDVAEFISNIPRCNCTWVFKEHEVDGESLFSLDPEMMVKLMGLKTGPALRIYRKINELKKQFETGSSSTD